MRDYSTYVELKRQKAKEQGKQHWFEGKLTDEEACVRTVDPEEKKTSLTRCVFCRYWDLDRKACKEGLL